MTKKLSMKIVTFLAVFFISIRGAGQHFEMVYRSKTDTTQNKYLAIIPGNTTVFKCWM